MSKYILLFYLDLIACLFSKLNMGLGFYNEPKASVIFFKY